MGRQCRGRGLACRLACGEPVISFHVLLTFIQSPALMRRHNHTIKKPWLSMSHFAKLGYILRMCFTDPLILWFRIRLSLLLGVPSSWSPILLLGVPSYFLDSLAVGRVSMTRLKSNSRATFESSQWPVALQPVAEVTQYSITSQPHLFVLQIENHGLRSTRGGSERPHIPCLATFLFSSRSSKTMSSQKGGLQSTPISWLSWGGTGGLISILLLPFHRREKESCL